MGSNDLPPPHVPAHVVPTCAALLQIGGALWTLCYVLLVRESFASRSYGMPLFALALNFSWEAVYALLVAESALERAVFTIWLLIDCGLIYGVVAFGREEWRHAPLVARNLAKVLAVLVVVAGLGHWSFAAWWIEQGFGARPGKVYRGVEGLVDVTELGFWSAVVAQVYLSAASLAQVLVRGHSGGVSWGIWITRTLGSIVGLYANYGWAYYFWREAHEYFLSPFAIFLCGTGLVCDMVYALALWHVRKSECVLADGRKAANGSQLRESSRKVA